MSPARIRSAVIAGKSQAVERMLAGVRTLPLATEAEFLADPRMVAAGESFLRRGLEALFDLGRYVLAKGFGEPVAEYRTIAQRLGEHAVLDAAQAERLRSMAGYRNRLVHFYDAVTPADLYRVLTEHIEDVRQILEALRGWFAAHPERIDDSL